MQDQEKFIHYRWKVPMFRKIHLWQINSQEKLKVNMKLISKSEIDQRCKIPFPTPPKPRKPHERAYPKLAGDTQTPVVFSQLG